MRRLAPVATAIAFVAFLTSPALARPHDIPSASSESRSYDRDDDDRDDYVRERRHRRSAQRSQPAACGKAGDQASARPAQRAPAHAVSRRGITSYAGGASPAPA